MKKFWVMYWMGCLLLVGHTTLAADPKPYFVENFEGEAAEIKQITPVAIEESPTGGQRFLGPLTNEAVTLSLKKLPKHKYVKIELDLYILRSWDGTNAQVGPDRWQMLLVDGKKNLPLIDSSFCNTEHNKASRQSYPARHGQGAEDPRTGAEISNNLGYRFAYGSVGDVASDTTYRLTRIVPHDGDTLTVTFKGNGLQDPADEAWGMDNIKVTLYEESPAPKVKSAEMKKWLETLGSADGVAAEQAVMELLARADATLALLKDTVLPKDDKTQRDVIEALIVKLDDEDFGVREQATKELGRFDLSMRPVVMSYMDSTKSPEARWRLREAIENMSGPTGRSPVSSKKLTELRKLERIRLLLTLINTPASRELLESAMEL